MAPSAYTLSGLATWLDYVIPGLAKYGWQAHLALVSGRRHHRPDRYLAEHPGLNPLIAHCDTDTPRGRQVALERMLAGAAPDVAVAVNIPDLYVAINRARSRDSTSVRAVMSVHGIEHYLYADMRRYRAVVDAVICSNRLACALSTRIAGVAADRVLYAPYGVSATGDKQAGNASDCLRIVYSGRLETAQKRCMDLVGIATHLRARELPFRLDVAGDGPDRAALETALCDFIADGTVVFHGYVTPAKLRSHIYSAAHALIITSSWETGPIVAWEAMAQGVCVVSSRYIGSGREAALATGQNCLLFEIGDTQAAAVALTQIWRSADLREKLRQGGRDLIEQRYSVDRSVTSWNLALERAVQRQPRMGAELPATATRGSLDKWLGVERAQQVRAAFGLQPPLAQDAGGEWPHAHDNAPSDEGFWRLAQEQDMTQANERSVEPHVA